MNNYVNYPLSGGSIERLPALSELEKSANYGLWFNRFFNGYDQNFDGFWERKDDRDKNKKLTGDTEFLKEITSRGKCGQVDAIEDAVKRQITLVNALGGQNAGFQCDWHLVTGMGNEHPLENGFTWHPTLGTPYIPGSTVKGLVRAWMEEFTDQSEDERQQWFGSKLKPGASSDDNQKARSEDNQTGGLIFFDALPINEPQLAIDIMTPHMGKWYEKGDDAGQVMNADTLPGDWHAPVPVPFLVSRNTQLMFSVALRPGSSIEIAPVMKVLEDALAWLGVGSKTAIGYGHMNRDDALLQALRDEVEKAELTPEQLIVREIDSLFKTETTENRSAPSRQKLIELAKTDLSDWPPIDKDALWNIAEKVFALHSGDNVVVY